MPSSHRLLYQSMLLVYDFWFMIMKCPVCSSSERAPVDANGRCAEHRRPLARQHACVHPKRGSCDRYGTISAYAPGFTVTPRNPYRIESWRLPDLSLTDTCISRLHFHKVSKVSAPVCHQRQITASASSLMFSLLTCPFLAVAPPPPAAPAPHHHHYHHHHDPPSPPCRLRRYPCFCESFSSPPRKWRLSPPPWRRTRGGDSSRRCFASRRCGRLVGGWWAPARRAPGRCFLWRGGGLTSCTKMLSSVCLVFFEKKTKRRAWRKKGAKHIKKIV